MTAQQLRQTLISLRKAMRKQRIDNDAWLSGVLFAVVNDTGARLSYDQVREMAHPSFADALPPPSPNDQQARNFASGIRKHNEFLGETACGWLYQLYCEESRRASQQVLQQSNKQCTTQDRIAFTQIYTPDWVSDYLLKQCLSAPAQNVADKPKTLLDPACGAGNILSRGLRLLAGQAARSGIAAPHNAALANIYGADIDPKAVFIAHLSLLAQVSRAGENVTQAPNLLCLADSDLGSLERHSGGTHWFSARTKYSAVVTNPPYIGRKLLDRKLKDLLRAAFPLAHNDISAAFLLRGLELLESGGRLGLITQSAQFFLPSFAEMRAHILEHFHIDSFVELGAGAFPLQSGEKVNSALVVICKTVDSSPSLFLDVSGADDKCAALSSITTGESNSAYICNQSQFLSAPGKAFSYKAPPCLQRLHEISSPLAELADVRQGLATTDNGRFVRHWQEVTASEIGSRWVPYVKGAGSERWWAPIENVVLWEDSGAAIKQAVRDSYPYLNGKTAWVVKNESYYFRPGLVFSFVNTRQFCARLLPAGCIFDVAASAIFPAEQDPYALLAFLNSSFCALQANLLNPTINFQVGDLKKFLVPNFDQATNDKLRALARGCLSTKQLINKPRGTVCGQGAAEPDKLGAAWIDYCEGQVRALVATEHLIDELVLDYVCRALYLNETDQLHLQRLCAEQQQKRRPPSYPIIAERN